MTKKHQEEVENKEPIIEPEIVEEIDPRDAKIAELTDKLMRSQAEFENFRRRTIKEKMEITEFVKSQVLCQFLPTLDNFDRALGAPDGESFRQGIEMIRRQLWETLEKQGVATISAKGCAFDPQYHDAVMREANEKHPEGTVLEELQPGYKIGELVLRPAMVKVSGN